MAERLMDRKDSESINFYQHKITQVVVDEIS